MAKFLILVVAALPLAATAQARLPCELLPMIQMAPQMQSGASGYLGITIANIDANHAKAVKLDEERGVEIKAVMEGSPADAAGIQPGDVLLSYNGESLLSAQQLSRLVEETPPGRKVKVEYWRDGKSKTAVLAVAAAPSRPFIPGFQASWPSASIDIPQAFIIWENPAVGIEFERVDSQLATYFGVNGGMLIRSVERGSPADRAGLRAGDVVYSVGEQGLSTEHDLSLLLRQHGTSVKVSVVRDHKHLDLSISIP